MLATFLSALENFPHTHTQPATSTHTYTHTHKAISESWRNVLAALKWDIKHTCAVLPNIFLPPPPPILWPGRCKIFPESGNALSFDGNSAKNFACIAGISARFALALNSQLTI